MKKLFAILIMFCLMGCHSQRKNIRKDTKVRTACAYGFTEGVLYVLRNPNFDRSKIKEIAERKVAEMMTKIKEVYK